jgi:hypothetical protein
MQAITIDCLPAPRTPHRYECKTVPRSSYAQRFARYFGCSHHEEANIQR